MIFLVLALLLSGCVVTPLKTGGRALPPKGFVYFCQREPAVCKNDSPSLEPVALTEDRWSELQQVNASVNGSFAFVEDAVDTWDYPVAGGDCEDFALEKQRQLLNKGWPLGSLLLATANVPGRGGHAVLIARTSAGDYVLDILSQRIKEWSHVPYHWLRRQSSQNPLVWVKISSQ